MLQSSQGLGSGQGPADQHDYDQAEATPCANRRVHHRHNILVRIHRAAAGYVHRVSQRSANAAKSPTCEAMHSAQKQLRNFVDGNLCNNTVMLAIVVNSILLALESADMSQERATMLETANIFFTWLFFIEFALKLVAMGAIQYFSSIINILDATVVIISVVETVFSGASSGISALRSLKTFRVLKSLRVLRVVRAFRYLRALSVITEVLANSITSFSAIGMLIAIFLVVFAIIGLQTYGTYELDIGYPNFHTFFNSLVIVFQARPRESTTHAHPVAQ